MLQSSGMRVLKTFILALFVISALIFPNRANAQTVLPTYKVESGDTLYSIAYRFGLTINELLGANSIPNPDNLPIGMEISIPGYEGISGSIISNKIQPFQTIRTVALTANATPYDISRLSRVTSPSELYVGSEMFTLQPAAIHQRTPIDRLAEGSTVEETALLTATNPWSLKLASTLNGESRLLPGDDLFAFSAYVAENNVVSRLPLFEIDPSPIYQGRTFTLKLSNLKDVTPSSASFNNQQLTFHATEQSSFVALAGTIAVQEPGLLPLSIELKDANGQVQTENMSVYIQQAAYGSEYVVGVEDVTLSEESIQTESNAFVGLINNTEPRYWETGLAYPIDEPCLGSLFGKSRDYNNGSYFYYHTGLDFTICKANNLNIYAASGGKVIFTGSLPIRGLFTLIDHGWGVYTGYAHQETSLVTIGEEVEPGQPIGIVGNTGRSAGPHLHFEVWVNGIAVDPLQWLNADKPILK